MPVSDECQCLFLHSQASYLKDTLTPLKLACETGPDNTFFCIRNDACCALKTRKRKHWTAEQRMRRHFAFLTCAPWLADWCLAHASAVWRPGPSALEESAECWWMRCEATWLWTGDLSLTPVFVPSTYVFSKALALAAPHRISPPRLMWCHTSALWVLEWCCWGNTTRDKTSPQYPHNKCGLCVCVWMHAASSVSAAGYRCTHTPICRGSCTAYPHVIP